MKKSINLPHIHTITHETRLHVNDLDFQSLLMHYHHKDSFSCLLSGGTSDCASNACMGFDPFLKLFCKQGIITLSTSTEKQTIHHDIWDVLKIVFSHYSHLHTSFPGAIGFFSYECGHYIEQLPYIEDIENIDDIAIFFFSQFYHLNRLTHRLTHYRIETNVPPFETTHEQMRNSQFSVESIHVQTSFDSYVQQLKQVIHYIREGDIYQANISQKFTVMGTFSGFDLFLRLFRLNPAPFFAYIHTGDYEIICTSPERFIRCIDNHVETRPIKGTIERGNTDIEDKQNQTILLNSEKDQAELSMIIDLLRNDIGKCATPGSVRVTHFKKIEQYQNVYHLIGIVESELSPPYDVIDLMKACFPGGSITGCPKIRSMEIISEIEKETRGIYTGSIFYHGYGPYFDSNIAIRTLLIKNNRLTFRVGGGIVYDSIPEKEYQETIHKGRSILQALGFNYNHYLQNSKK